MDLIKQINDEIASISKEENIDKDRAFIIWILEQYYNVSRDEAVNVITDTRGDKRIDAFIEREDSISIIQCKYFESHEKQVGEKEVVVFKGCIDWLKQPEEIQKLNLYRLYDASLTFMEKWNAGDNIELHYFAFGKFCSNANQEKRVFNNSDSKDRIQMYFHDIDDILNLFQANLQTVNPLSAETISFQIIPEQIFHLKEETFPAIVASIKGKELALLHLKYGDRLFERNIRLFKGVRKGSINAGIIDTVKDDTRREKFWYFNNGVSFVCSDFKIDEKHHTLTVVGPQIINGCQTTVCLSEALNQIDEHKFPDNLSLLARFIKAPINDVELITLYTNSQNPVSEAQLKSLDPIQKRFKRDFDNYVPPYFYSIKEGDWKTLSKEDKQKYEDRVIDIIRATQGVYSFLKDPAFARRYRIELFSKKYHEIFKKDTRVEEILLPWRILKVIDNKIAEFRKSFNEIKSKSLTDDSKKKEMERKEFLIYSNLIFLFYIQKLIRKYYGDYNADIANKLLNNQLEERVEKLFKYIVSVLSFSEKLKSERNLPRFLKNIDNIDLLYEEVEKEIEKDKAKGQDTLKDILPNIK